MTNENTFKVHMTKIYVSQDEEPCPQPSDSDEISF